MTKYTIELGVCYTAQDYEEQEFDIYKALGMAITIACCWYSLTESKTQHRIPEPPPEPEELEKIRPKSTGYELLSILDYFTKN